MSVARWLHPSRRLTSRIALFAFGATLISSLVVTGVSVRAIDRFLRAEIERRFPALLASTSERLDLWYTQRELDLGMVAEGEVLRRGLDPLLRGGVAAERARREIASYLEQLLEGIPALESFAVLREGATRPDVEVGAPFEEGALPRIWPPAFRGVVLGPVTWNGGRRLQLIAVPILGAERAFEGRLIGAISMAELDRVLYSPSVDAMWRLSLVDDEKQVVASTEPERLGTRLEAEWPAPPAGRATAEHVDAEGVAQVGMHRPFPRLGWTLVVQVPSTHLYAPVSSTIRRVILVDLAILLTLALAAMRLSLSITQPIEALSEAARRISEGEAPSALPRADRDDELGVLSDAFRAMATSLADKASELETSRSEVEEANAKLRLKNQELQRANEVFEQLSITDGLTKLHNHRYFHDQLVKEVRRAERAGAPLALILADIDHFKRWNDELGHAAGDQILRKVAEVLSQTVRDADLLARYGGEEFAVLAPDTDLPAAIALAERLRAAISRTPFFLGLPAGHSAVSASFGVAVLRTDGRTLFDEADAALYAAKEGGRDCVVGADALPRTEGFDG